ncbi:MAG: helix-turn-helix domain-containing protein [Tannerella sp.]|nr:helix-turn-helix domain-containing protein [Tannerella sp.]
MEEEFLTTEDIMKLFHICRDTVQDWIKNKKDFTKPIKFGRRNLWKPSVIDAYLDSARKQHPDCKS